MKTSVVVVVLVAVEELVRPLADLDDDRAALAREARDKVKRDAGRVRDRLVLVPYERREKRERLARADLCLVVLRRKSPRDSARIFELVVLTLAGEPDRVRAHRLVDQL